MRQNIPIFHRLRLLGVYARLALAYNAALSAIGALALTVLRAAGLVGEARARVEPGSVVAVSYDSQVRFAVVIFGILVATVGHVLAIVVVSGVHRSEHALYLSAGWGRGAIAFASWPIAIALGAIAVLAVRI